jgi:glucose-6-phosphate 1-epimerase
VVDWTPAGQAPVLWVSQLARFDSESPIRGGIPICWPWFGAGPRGIATPLHGFADLTEWRLVRSQESHDAASAMYMLIDARPDKFDSPYRLTYEVSFGREFSATLTVRNTGTLRFTFEEALHTYLAVGDVRQISLGGLDGTEYLDRVAGHELGPHRQIGDVRIEAETDRIYQTPAAIEIDDPVLERRITVTRTGSDDTVVWNPWIAKSKIMPDFGDDEWTSMICVETGNVAEHAITLNPGKEHVMGFTLKVVSTKAKRSK